MLRKHALNIVTAGIMLMLLFAGMSGYIIGKNIAATVAHGLKLLL